MSERTALSMSADFYERQVEKVAHGLRRLADDVEREGRIRDGRTLTGGLPYTDAAGRIVHSIAWGTANLNLSGVVDAASVCDAFWAEENPREAES